MATRAEQKPRPNARPARVLVAMSGGVDSSVAAALLHEQGLDVVGVTLHLWDAQGAQQVGRCCAPEDREDARRSCDALGIPHYVIDERDAFRAEVVDPFVADNLAGQTPIPCVRCNQSVKLGRLLEIADMLGASHVATGHYARLAARGDRVELLRGADHDKEQSYFLFGVGQPVLRRLIFPLGELTKAQTRAEGERLGVPNWSKPDSQELCFVPDGDVRGFIAEHAPSSSRPGRRGPVVDRDGTELGQHAGIEGFTVGQRRGLGVSAPGARYVLRVIPETSTVVVGTQEQLGCSTFEARDAAWVVPRGTESFEAQVRIRYRHHAAPARVTPLGADARRFRVEFDAAQHAVAPGQAAVVYDGDRVLGGGFIEHQLLAHAL